MKEDFWQMGYILLVTNTCELNDIRRLDNLCPLKISRRNYSSQRPNFLLPRKVQVIRPKEQRGPI